MWLSLVLPCFPPINLYYICNKKNYQARTKIMKRIGVELSIYQLGFSSTWSGATCYIMILELGLQVRMREREVISVVADSPIIN